MKDPAPDTESEAGTSRAESGPVDYGPFAYLSTPNAALYRRIMRVLMAEKERFTVHVRPEQVSAALARDGADPVEEDMVGEALERLAQPAWGNLLGFPDSSRVTALEDFYRRRMLYQLSHEGEAAERALVQYDAALGTRGALQSVALEDIVVLLTNLRDTVSAQEADRPVDAAVAHQTLRSLRERFVELAENAMAFMGSMQRTIDLHDADVEAFLAYKEELIAYLERFIHDLLTRGARISELLDAIPEEGVHFLAGLAADRESADAAPGAAQVERARIRRTWLRQWSGLAEWFVSTPVRESEAKLLRARARAAIPALLAVVRALHERSGGRTDRTQDFLTLATWFAALPADEDRHRLWRSAFGLAPVRHLSLTSATEDAWAEAELSTTTPWAQAPPVEISPQLRRSGSYERRGRATRVTDRTEAKRMLAERARQEAEQTAAARRRILTAGPRPMSAFGELEPDAFRLFLGLLGDALAAMGPTATTAQVHTSDGELTVILTRLPGAATMEISTPDGEFSGPDHLVDIASTLDVGEVGDGCLPAGGVDPSALEAHAREVCA
ncbi:TIGR02677 family protein [Brachybacterium vulturis]|uniref:TIGR02677 family protein n=1 Tax=Brachybacterium vulturis TaxID=2017484 RepID=A0A291GMA9_9MICO|nr:TIGR02677 family protein [Brachybacterium vulturis]ATG51355.1 TIGR02677 family protein [Brachybacterium vulturis]